MLESVFKNVTTPGILMFTLYVCCILAANWLVRAIAVYLGVRKPQFRVKYLPTITSLLNWATFYSVILLFLFYFSNASWLFYPLYSHGGVDVTLFLIIIAIMIVSLAHRLVKLFTKYVLSSAYDYYDVDKGIGYTLNQMLYYVVMIFAVAISLTSVGLDLTALAAIFGVLGIGIGFGMRNVAGNFVSGIIMLFERPVEVGQVIQITNKIGRIERIRLRSTVVRTAKEGTLIVPNQYFIEQIIKNRTGAEMMAQVSVSVAYGTDTENVDRLLNQAVNKIKQSENGILEHPSPDIRFIDIRNNSMEFLVEIPVANFEVKEQLESKLRHSIAKCFSDNSIKLAAVVFDQSAFNGESSGGLETTERNI